MNISKRAAGIAASATLAVNAKAKALRAQGVDVLNFGVGEPDFDTPAHIKQAAVDALNAGFTKYPSPVAGIPELREAIARKLERDSGLAYSPDEISVGVGGKNCLYALMQAVVDPGDEVLVPAPYWVSYVEMAKLAGGTPVAVDAAEEDDFKLTAGQLDAAITDKTRLVVLNSPSNPTGAVYAPDELAALAAVIVRRNLLVVSDEIYETLVYDGVEQRSLASFGPDIQKRTVVCNGLSKAYAMTGWRLGYLAGPAEVIAAVNKLQSHSTSGPTAFVQKAAVTALTASQDCVAEMQAEFDRRRRVIVESVRALPGVTCREPAGAFYVFPNIGEWIGRDLAGRRIGGSADFASACLEDAHVALVPGVAFGSDRHVRISYAASLDAIREAMDRLGRLLAGA